MSRNKILIYKKAKWEVDEVGISYLLDPLKIKKLKILLSLDSLDKNMNHYANMSVQYTAIFHGCKNGNFHMKKCDIFLNFAQNIDRWYTLEPPH